MGELAEFGQTRQIFPREKALRIADHRQVRVITMVETIPSAADLPKSPYFPSGNV